VVCLEATPLILVGSMIFIIDTVLLLFFLWAALGFWTGFEQGDKKSYYWAGLALGLALLSKLTAVLFPLACFLFLAISGERRKRLGDIHLYLALFLGLAVLSPFIFWNMTHDWISIQAQLEKGLSGGRDWNQTLGFWFGQPLILGPVLFYFALKALREGFKKFKQDPRYAYLVLLTIIPTLFFGVASFRGKYSDPAWTDIGWPFGAILLGHYFSERLSAVSSKKAWVVGGLIFFTSWLPIGMMAWQALRPIFPVPVQNDRTLEMRGWRELGTAMGLEYQRTFPGKEKVYVVAEEYQVAAAVSFYTPQHPVPYSFGKAKRNFWVTPEELKTHGAFLVCRTEKCAEDQRKIRPLFQTTRHVTTIPFYRQSQLSKEFQVYLCSN
jgi:4-amino-4-deoxy-L-arabinose transferase-like glycosyltransferase